MVLDDELKASVLHRLAKRRKWGESHTAFENVARGVPSHLRKRFTDAAEELIKEGLIVKKPTSYGLQISLNVEKSEEIKWRIKKYLDATV